MLGLLLAGCGHDYTDIASSESRDTSPSTADVPQLVADEASFAFDFYRVMGEGSKSNVFFSPYSISAALAMTYAGAAGTTASQIATAMHFSLPPERLHTAFDALDLALTSRKDVRLAIANSIWGQRSLAFGKPFLDTLAVDYGSEIRGVDFIGASAQATNAIDGWVADQTGGKIQNLFAPGSLGADTRVVVVNAVWFDADWQTKFDASKTAAAPFTKLDGTVVSAPMMNLDSLDVPLAIEPTYTAIDLPYAGGQTSMLVIVPSGGQFANVEAALGGDFLARVVSSLQPASGVSLSLPKFTLTGQSVSLSAALQALGMTDAFVDGKADFSPMSTSEPLHIDDVVHQAYVRVDENGTEAAAATGVGIGDLAIAELAVNVNRPFFFVLRDIPTGAALFVGRVMDPTLNGN